MSKQTQRPDEGEKFPRTVATKFAADGSIYRLRENGPGFGKRYSIHLRDGDIQFQAEPDHRFDELPAAIACLRELGSEAA